MTRLATREREASTLEEQSMPGDIHTLVYDVQAWHPFSARLPDIHIF